MQNFKGDETELKFIAAGLGALDSTDLQLDAFHNGAYETGPLGDLIYDNDLSPLSNAIDKTIFRSSFKQIFDSFVFAGTFESYITVFKKIFGDDAIIEFTVPGPGELQIDIEAAGIELSDFIARYIDNNQYFFDEVVDENDDNIAFQTIKGFQTQYELEQMLFEMVPAGIYTEITLDLGV